MPIISLFPTYLAVIRLACNCKTQKNINVNVLTVDKSDNDAELLNGEEGGPSTNISTFIHVLVSSFARLNNQKNPKTIFF